MIEQAARALTLGELVVLPTDTVYGLCADPDTDASVRRLYALKRRPEQQAVALLAADVDDLFECVPELRGPIAAALRALLPGPYTFVVPNPARRYRRLTGNDPEKLGVRVPDLPAAAVAVVGRVGAVAATSANLHGGADPQRLDEVPYEIRAACAAVVDGGELPGIASTVVDVTGPEPRVLREGAVPAAEAIRRVAAALP